MQSHISRAVQISTMKTMQLLLIVLIGASVVVNGRSLYVAHTQLCNNSVASNHRDIVRP